MKALKKNKPTKEKLQLIRIEIENKAKQQLLENQTTIVVSERTNVVATYSMIERYYTDIVRNAKMNNGEVNNFLSLLSLETL